MPTVINNPAPTNEGGNGMGFLIGIIVLAVIAIIFIFYGLPYLRSFYQAPQINVPNKIDVNIKQTK